MDTYRKHAVECDQCGQTVAFGTGPEDAAQRHERTCTAHGAVWSVRLA